MENKKRVDWIDGAKGIAILLTIIGHSVSYGRYGSSVRGLIFSFHMPLFFILSCATYRCSANMSEYKAKTIRAAKHLLTPVLVTYVIITAYQCFQDHGLFANVDFWKGKLYTLIYSSGVNYTFYNFEVPAMGIPWFFFALFLGRTVFDFLHMKFKDKGTLLVVCSLTSMIGIVVGRQEFLPFSLDIALAVMLFFYVGNSIKENGAGITPPGNVFMLGIIWLVTLWLAFPDYEVPSYLELAGRRYTLFPICYVTAIAGTLFIGKLSASLCKAGKIFQPILYIGKNSMTLLYIHILDGIWYQLWNVEGHQFNTAAKRTVVDLAIFAVVMIIKHCINRSGKHGKIKESPVL